MKESQKLLLAEMGIKPLWRLRDAPTHEPATDVAADPAFIPPSSVVAIPSPSVADIAPMAPQMPAAVARAAHPAQAMGWDELRSAVAECRACGLCEKRKQAVLGVGDPQADWMLVGEGPGAEEDERGEPFVGQAGKLLDAMLASIGLKRGENVYIANAVKCRPPGNRTPEVEEMNACRPFLERQIALVKPKLIVALGRPAAQTLLGSELKISSSRNRLLSCGETPVVVTYHPAYLLRNLHDKAKAWEDLCFAQDEMAKLSTNAH